MNCQQTLAVLSDLRTASLPPVLVVQSSLDRARCLIASNHRDQARQALTPALERIEADDAFRPLMEEAVQLEPALLDQSE